jgi:hypothetical protein
LIGITVTQHQLALYVMIRVVLWPAAVFQQHNVQVSLIAAAALDQRGGHRAIVTQDLRR